jgi:inner membrane protein involved in colicin E2 resistance
MAACSIATHPLENRVSDEGERLSVAFVGPVNAYTQTDLAIKYGNTAC